MGEAMASLKVTLFLFLLFHFIFRLSSPVLSDDKMDTLLQGLNNYRTANRLRPFTKNNKARCLADEIANKLEDEPCNSRSASNPVRLQDYPEVLSKCGININHTAEGVVLPVCVPKLVPTLVLSNYTHTRYVGYINDSKYSGAGVGSEEDWVVVALAADGQAARSFKKASSLVSEAGFGNCLVRLWLGIMVLHLVY